MSLAVGLIYIYIHKCERCGGAIISTSLPQCIFNTQNHYLRHGIRKKYNEIKVKKLALDVDELWREEKKES